MDLVQWAIHDKYVKSTKLKIVENEGNPWESIKIHKSKLQLKIMVQNDGTLMPPNTYRVASADLKPPLGKYVHI